MSETVTEPGVNNSNGSGSSFSMGLNGWGKVAANLTAVAVVCYLLWQGQQRFYDYSVADREMHRTEMAAFRTQMEQQRTHDEKMRDITHSLIRDNQRTLEDSQRSLTRTIDMMAELVREVKAIKSKE